MASQFHLTEVAKNFKNFRLDGFLCDTVLTTRDGELKAHSLILASTSSVFRTVFEGGDVGPSIRHISLPDIDAETLEIALSFMYTGTLSNLPNAYRKSDQLQGLFGILKDLGLDEDKLSRSEITFCSDEEADGESNAGETCDDIYERGEERDPVVTATVDDALTEDMYSAEEDEKLITDPDQVTDTDTAPLGPENLPSSIRQKSNGNVWPNAKTEVLPVDEQEHGNMWKADTDDADSELVDEDELKCLDYEFLNVGDQHDRIRYECRTCGKTFSLVESLTKHMLMHEQGVVESQPLLFSCLACGELFTNDADLTAHISSQHDQFEYQQLSNTSVASTARGGRSPAFSCATCGKKFVRIASLKNHAKSHIDDSKSFACSECSAVFVRQSQLLAHSVIHSSRHKFICRYCAQDFTQRSALTQHERTHAGFRPFKCTTCGKSFTVRSMLRQHENLHTGARPHTCKMCDKAFAYKESLIVHTRIHTGEKPFTCDVCGTAYTQSHHLKGHKLTHTGLKPFSCDYCEKSYKNRVDLRSHSVRVHQVDITKRQAVPKGINNKTSSSVVSAESCS